MAHQEIQSLTAMKSLRLPLAAAIAAIAITTTMDFTGYLVFSALPLTGLILVFWLIQRQSKAEIGLVLGSLKHYGLALVHPVVVLGLAALAASLSGTVSLDEADWGKLGINVLAGSTVGVLSSCSPRRGSSGAGSGELFGGPT